MRILFVGGGTLGPVTPLLALADFLRKQEGVDIVGFVGTRQGVERDLVQKAGFKFYAITAGKLRRYFDIRNALAPVALLVGFFEAFFLLVRLRPTVIVSGGSFVGLPVILAAWFLRIPSITHQQDVVPSLANRLAAPFVKKMTVTFEETRLHFGQKTVVTGNPVREAILRGDKERGIARFGLDSRVPTVLVFGGGTGARAINELVWSALPELTKFCQVIHITGRGKLAPSPKSFDPPPSEGEDKITPSLDGRGRGEGGRYHPFELLIDEMPDAYAAADLVVSRAGVGTITELAALGKPAIIIPMQHTHQEANAAFLARKNAAVILREPELTPSSFSDAIKSLLENNEKRAALASTVKTIMPPDATNRIVNILLEIEK